MKRSPRYRLRMGFEDDFGIIDAQIFRIETVEIKQEEQIEWIDAEVPIRRFRIRSNVVLGLLAVFIAGVGLIL